MNPDAATLEADTTAERWCLVFVAEAGPVPPGRRVAQVLRFAKRRQGLKCIEVSATTLHEQVERLKVEVLELQAEVDRLRRKANQRNSTQRAEV